MVNEGKSPGFERSVVSRMWKRCLLLFLLGFVDASTAQLPNPPQQQPITTTTTPPVRPKVWALLVAGSNGYSNYRHQADVCHAYQILHANGLPDENIIVMMYDDIANSTENPTPGIIINHPKGPNVYEGVLKDYTGDDVNSENFLNILSGNKEAMRGIGSGKVIESGPNDVVFVNFVDHGGAGTLYFPNDELQADRFIKALSKMAATNKFSKLILYVEACHAGSMFDSLLSDTTNVFVLAAADPFESSYACYYDEEREAYLGDVFSVVWMDDTEHESLPIGSLHHQFERVRTMTNTSHVEEYGDLDIGTTKLKDVLGFRMRQTEMYTSTRSPTIHVVDGKSCQRTINKLVFPNIIDFIKQSAFTEMDTQDVVNNMDVPLILLDKKLIKEQDPIKKRQLKMEKHNLIKKRTIVDQIFREIIFKASEGINRRMDELRISQNGLNWNNFHCYKELYRTVNKMCMNSIQSPYVRIHLQTLINMCSVSWLTLSQSVDTIAAACSESQGLTRLIRVY